MTASDPFSAHPDTDEIDNRWTRAGATQDEARILGSDDAVADKSDGDLREAIDALRADAVEVTDDDGAGVDGEAPQDAQDAPDDATATDAAPEGEQGAQGDADEATAEGDVSQVTPDSE